MRFALSLHKTRSLLPDNLAFQYGNSTTNHSATQYFFLLHDSFAHQARWSLSLLEVRVPVLLNCKSLPLPASVKLPCDSVYPTSHKTPALPSWIMALYTWLMYTLYSFSFPFVSNRVTEDKINMIWRKATKEPGKTCRNWQCQVLHHAIRQLCWMPRLKQFKFCKQWHGV